MKINGTVTTKQSVEAEVGPLDATEALKAEYIKKLGFSDEVKLRLKKDKWLWVEVQTYRGSHSWDEESIIREATEEEVKIYQAFSTLFNLFSRIY